MPKKLQPLSAETQRRIGIVANWVIEGVPSSEIMVRGESEFKVCQRQVHNYLKHAREKAIPELRNVTELNALAAEAIAKAEKIYHKCLTDAAAIEESRRAPLYMAALATLKHWGELNGISPMQRAATEIAELRAELERMNRAKESEVRAMTLEHYNRMRAVYGVRQLTEGEYQERKQRMIAAQVDLDPHAAP
jgi:sensor histidine kinase regulating citrate/malate metabolism